MLRWLEKWLHQHIFKVGWLTTKDFYTTTILYYTFFLPGVIVYELASWLAAGLLNVRAEYIIKWPEKQEIGRLELNFLKLQRNVHPLKKTLINLAPLLFGGVIIWFIANNIMRLPDVLTIIASGQLNDVVIGLKQLIQAPDFWLWFYIAFAISNTMIPDLNIFSGFKQVGIILIIVLAILTVIGVGSAILTEILGGPVATILNVLSGILAVIIAMDILVVGILAAVENTIEYITGDSADFKNGKMITMTREERMTQRMRTIEKQRQARERSKIQKESLPTGSPSIYRLPLPLPGVPGEVDVTPLQQIIIEDTPPLRLGDRRIRAGAGLIPGKITEDENRQIQSPTTTLQLPAPEKNNEEED